MTKTVLIGIARMGSTRLPGKVLMDLGGIPVLRWIWEAADNAKLVDDVVIATTTDPRDDAIEAICKEHGIECYRGSEDDVLTRFVGAAISAQATVAVRVTCDCPFVDPSIIDQVIALREATGADYASNIDPPTWPDGMDCEAITVDALALTKHRATSKIDRECVTTFIQRNKHLYHCENLTCPLPSMHKERWVLDTEADYTLCRSIAENVPEGGWLAIKRYLDQNPEERQLNAHHPRNERFYAAIAEELLEPRIYTKSKELLARAEKTIPLAAQTFSKSKIQYPADSPLFLTHGDGGYCFDVDGNRYVDLVGGLLPVILGYRDPDVDAAVRRQLDRGISFSLATELEAELSETLCRLIPSAEMTRFGKNGTDVTTAAVRLARAYTGRDLILSSGYHGWADWSVAHDQVRNRGVPNYIAECTTSFAHGDLSIVINALRGGNVAAVVVEPETNPEYLRELRKRCDAYGAVLIFDEIITWPRWGLAGAQGAYKVTPDLTCISKAMANGMPISALVGKREIMSHMEKISYSGTFFGETLSIAAAIATIKKLENENVIQKIQSTSSALAGRVTYLLGSSGVPIGLGPHDALRRLEFGDQDIKTLFIQEMAQAGTLIIASHNLSYAHGPNEIKRVLSSYDHALSVIRDAIDKNDIKDRIHGHSIPSHANVRAVS